MSNLITTVIKIRNRTFYQSQNPTCRIYPGVELKDATLEGMNILFNDTSIISSTLGKHTYVQKRTTIVNAEIGRFCSIASKVCIGPGLHKIDCVSSHPAFFSFNTPLIKTFVDKDLFKSNKKTCIGHDVWIGENVIVIDGIVIGTGAVIAAGAVVTRDVAPYAIVGGVPAKLIRYRFNTKIINDLLESRWWDNNDEWFKEKSLLFNNPIDFIRGIKNG